MSKIKIGYAIWPWGVKTKDQMVQALKDIKEVGYTRFESVRNAIDAFDLDADAFESLDVSVIRLDVFKFKHRLPLQDRL